jgi:hypothetical protein
MALFSKRNNLLTVEAPPAKRGRGRPRKIEQLQQGSQPSTEIVQSRAGQNPKFGLPANKKWFYAGLVILIAVIPTIYFYAQNKNTEKKLNELQNGTTSTNVDVVVKQVGKLVILPTDERPTLATVSDASKLKSQPFFVDAANGDKLLVYSKSKKVILYRPSQNKIVDMALNSSDQPTP